MTRKLKQQVGGKKINLTVVDIRSAGQIKTKFIVKHFLVCRRCRFIKLLLLFLVMDKRFSHFFKERRNLNFKQQHFITLQT